MEASLESGLSFKGLSFTLIGLFILIQGVVFLLVPKSQLKKSPYLPKKAWLRDTPTKRLLWLNLIPYPLLLCLSLNQLDALSLLNALFLFGLFCLGTYGLFKVGDYKHFIVLSGLSFIELYAFSFLFRFAKPVFINQNGKAYASFSDLESAMFLLFLVLFALQGLVLIAGLRQRKGEITPVKATLLDYLLWLSGLAFPALFYFHHFILEGQKTLESLYLVDFLLLFLLALSCLSLYRRLGFKDYLFALIPNLVTSFELALLSLKKLYFLIPYNEGLRYTEPILGLYFITILSLTCILLQGELLLIRIALAYLKSDPK